MYIFFLLAASSALLRHTLSLQQPSICETYLLTRIFGHGIVMKELRCFLLVHLGLLLVPAAGEFPIYNFTQKLNHSNPNSATFQQRYQLMTQWYRPGGPILFVQGAESPDLAPIEAFYFTDYAQELGAAVATLEHRYFGTSFPEDFDAAHPNSSFAKGLTIENVLLDSVTFIEWLRRISLAARIVKSLPQAVSNLFESGRQKLTHLSDSRVLRRRPGQHAADSIS